MKHNFTKLLAIVAVLFLSIWNVMAQTSVYPGTFPIVMTGYDAILTNPKAAGWMIHSSTTPSNTSRTDKCFSGALAEVNMNAGRFLQYRLPSCGTITISCDGTSGRGFWITAKDASNNSLSVTRTEIIDGINNSYLVVGSGTGNTATCTTMSFEVNTSNEVYIKIYSPLSGEIGDGITSYGSTYISNITITDNTPLTPQITKFVAEGVEATIDQNAKTITAQLPYGSSLTSITPTVTIGGTATDYSPKGAQDFTNPVTYTAIGSPADVDYTVTLTVNPTPSSDKDLSNVTIGGKTPIFDAGTNTYSIILPKASSLTQTVSFTKPSTATANFTSGNSHDFTNPLQITVTAQDGSTKVYTLTAQVGIADIAYVSNAATPHANDTKIYPMLIEKGYYVNVIAASGTDLTQFNPYDIVVLCENVSSSNTLALAMNGLIKTKRFLSFKAFMYGKTGWPTGTPSDGTSDADVAIEADYLGHPIFTGVTLTGNLANILTSPATKGVQGVLNPQENVSSKIAYLTSSGNADKVALIENNQMPSAKYLMIPIQTDSYAKVNANGLKLIENAITYLLTDTKYGPYTGVTKNNLTNISFDGRTILNPERQQLYVYNATGGLVASSVQDINMSAQAKGVYLVKGENGMMKIAVTN